MRILLTNDDGIRAPGIEALHDALIDAHGHHGGPIADVVQVCAPLTVQSATSHGVTFHQPLMKSEVRVSERMEGIAVDGRPADCVKLALSNLWPEIYGPGELPDLVISGMNAGANVGINVIYSGTVAAALEAAFLGVPAIAVSLHLAEEEPLWDVAARHAREAIETLLRVGGGDEGARALDRHTCLNVGIPRTERDGPTPPIVACPMNTHGLVDAYERRTSPAGDIYYWAAGHGLDFRESSEGADVEYMHRGCITVTPLRYDLTDLEALERWRVRIERAHARA
ncbi:MAG: 5'/3'-nucleotidase SurE [Phycisphaeraceae bacterium]|nr:MAG: 5'/3'-nucleotidase SurE [Phycisphaeraceae bacterium]